MSKLAGGKATHYRHDEQMGIEDVETQGASKTVTCYGLGARGVDMIERTASNGAVTTGFPLCDAAGNRNDASAQDSTFFIYCGDNPIGRFDQDGQPYDDSLDPMYRFKREAFSSTHSPWWDALART